MTDPQLATLALSLVIAGVLLLAAAAVLRFTRKRRQNRHPQSAQELADLMEQLENLALRIEERIDRRLEEVRQECDRATCKIAELRSLGAPKADSPAPRAPARSAEALRLHRQGLSAVEIARQTGLDIGEVELVLNLHRPRPAEPLRQTAGATTDPE